MEIEQVRLPDETCNGANVVFFAPPANSPMTKLLLKPGDAAGHAGAGCPQSCRFPNREPLSRYRREGDGGDAPLGQGVGDRQVRPSAKPEATTAAESDPEAELRLLALSAGLGRLPA